MYTSVLGRLPLKVSCTTLNAKYVHVYVLYEKQEASYTVSNRTAQGAYSWLDYFQITFLHHLISSNWISPYKIFSSHFYLLTEVSGHFLVIVLFSSAKKKAIDENYNKNDWSAKLTLLYTSCFCLFWSFQHYLNKLQKKHLNSVWGCWAMRLGLWVNSPNSHFTIDSRCYLWLFLFVFCYEIAHNVIWSIILSQQHLQNSDVGLQPDVQWTEDILFSIRRLWNSFITAAKNEK